jgi:hypothetical protein
MMQEYTMEGSVEDRKNRYEKVGMEIRKMGQRPSYAGKYFANYANVHNNLGVQDDPIWYTDPFHRGLFLHRSDLNIRMGILQTARERGIGTEIDWQDIDWECVPDTNEVWKEVTNLLIRDAPTSELEYMISNAVSGRHARTRPFLSTLTNGGPLNLPDIIIEYSSSNTSFDTFPDISELISLWVDYMSPRDDTDDYIVRYYGLRSMMSDKDMVNTDNTFASFPKVLTEMILFYTRNSVSKAKTLYDVFGGKFLLLYAKAAMNSAEIDYMYFAKECVELLESQI